MSANSYIVRSHGQIVKVLCKLCGCTIRGLVPMGDPVETRKNGNMVIRDNMMMLGIGGNYRQIVLETELTDDKGNVVQRGKHVTCICNSCKKQINSQNIGRLYAEDLREFKREGMDVSELMKWRATRLIGEEALS